MPQWVSEPGDMWRWDLLRCGINPRNGVHCRLPLSRGIQEHGALHCWLHVWVRQPVQSVISMCCGEILSCRRVERGELRSGQLLPLGLVQPDHVHGRLLLSKRVCPATVRGGLCVCQRVCESGDVQGGHLLP